MSNSNRSIGNNAILNGIKTLFSVIFPLITYPYAARVLLVENMGKVDFSNSVVSYFVLLAGLGISTYAIREGAGIRDNRETLASFASEMFTINLISALISELFLIILLFIVPKFHSYLVLILAQSIAIFGNLIGVLWLYTLLEDYLYITIRSLIVHLVALVLLFSFVRDQNDYLMYALTTIIANVGANVFNFIHARKYITIHLVKSIDFRKHLRPILIIFASAITTTVYVNSDRTILGFLSDEYHVGLYSISVNIYSVLKTIVASVILVALPRLSNYLANGRISDYNQTAKSIFMSFFFILIPIMVGVFFLSDDIIHLIGGSAYRDAAVSLRILSVSLVFSMLATFYTNAVLLPYKYEAVVMRSTIISALVNVVLNLVLLSHFHQNGAAFTTLIAEMIMFGYQFNCSKKLLILGIPLRFYFEILFACVFVIATIILLDATIPSFAISLALKIVLSSIIYLFVLYCLKNDICIRLVSLVSNKLSRLS